MCDMTRPYVCHDSFTRVTWLIHMCDMTRPYACHESFRCVTCLIQMCDVTHTWLICMCDMSHSDVCPDAYIRHSFIFIRVTKLNHTCDVGASQKHEWVMSHTWMSHVTQKNESCHKYEFGEWHTCWQWVQHGMQGSALHPLQTSRLPTLPPSRIYVIWNIYIMYICVCILCIIWVCVIAIITHGEEKHTPSTHAYANYTPVKNLNNITFICYIYMCMFLMYVRVCVIAIIYTWERGAHSTDTRIRQLCLRQESVWCNAYILCIYVYLHYVWMSICDCGYTYMRKSSTLHRHTHLPTLPPSRICMI